ncbi:MAG: hypothetical protein HY872_08200 [Chloroflexi bacterium]|nr:hypothetical protein [Chloroflexota bacterium]
MNNTAQTILFVLVAIVMGWFAAGVLWNIRRGNAALKWMQGGLPRLGEKAALRWLGSSAVELTLAKARPPFRRAELVLVMEPRDVSWFWLLARLRGRRDMLIIRGQLVTPPQLEFDVVRPGSWSARETVGRNETRQWETESLADDATLRAPRATRALSRELAPAALQAARAVSPVVWRLSARRESPQFELHVPLPDPRRGDAANYFDSIRRVAEQVGKR